jgi:acetyl-CoA carboxylase/biotin carboxylase 1
MERAAQRLTQSIGYQGAGTVEYLFNAATGKFYFLELNPRLQVEHPVTEGLTGINLPATQLQVAMGIPLTNIPDVQEFYGRDRNKPTSDIDFMTEDYKKINNHVIAARITAENPDDGFKPTSGRIERISFKSTPKVWGYFSVGANGGIHEFADSQFGHLFASAASRDEARKHLILALKELDVKGDIRTAVTYLGELLQTDSFTENTIDTSWLDGLISAKSVTLESNPQEVVLASAAARAYNQIKDQMAQSAALLEKGQTGLSELNSVNSFPIEITYEDVKYSFVVDRVSSDTLQLSINGDPINVRIREQPDGSLLMKYAGMTHKVTAQEEPLGLRLTLDGQTIIVPTVFDPSELRSDITGKIVRFLQEEGEEVKKGEPYVEVEAMKMIMSFPAGETGKVTHNMSPGSVISTGDLLASLELKDPSKVKKILPFEGKLDSIASSGSSNDDPVTALTNAMDGYEIASVDSKVVQAIEAAKDAKEGCNIVSGLLRQYLSVEQKFAGTTNKDDVILQMVKDNKDSLDVVTNAVISHRKLKQRSDIVLSLLRGLNSLRARFDDMVLTDDLKSCLSDLAKLPGKGYGQVALNAQDANSQWNLGPFSERVAQLREQLKTGDQQALAESTSLSSGVDLLGSLMLDSDPEVRKAALEVYALRTYRPYRMVDQINVQDEGDTMTASFKFKYASTPDEKTPVRETHMKVVGSIDQLEDAVASLSLPFAPATSEEPLNTVHLIFSECPEIKDEDVSAYVARAEAAVAANKAKFEGLGIRNIVFMFNQPPGQPRYLNLVACNDFKEDPLRRDMRPSFPHLYELERMVKNYDINRIPTYSPNMQVYLGKEKSAPGARPARFQQQTLFVRYVTHENAFDNLEAAEREMLACMDEVERATLDPSVLPTSSSRIYIHVLPTCDISPGELALKFQKVRDKLVTKYAERLLRLRIDEIEVKIQGVGDDTQRTSQRLVASSLGGKLFDVKAYSEDLNPINGVPESFCITYPKTETEVCTMAPYPTSDKVQIKRANTRRIGTTYAYDFLGLFEMSLIERWESTGNGQVPENVFKAEELIMDESGEISEGFRIPGSNDVGMLAWKCQMKTPEYPEGREMVLIANDITFQSGSFGVREDDFFYKASELARKEGLPRVYIAANSGARIGLYEDLKPKFKVAWNDPSSPDKGFEYLYLTEEDYKSVPEGAVQATEVTKDGEKRFAINAIVGDEKVHGIGVENLRGSGMIAGETSRAYDEVFTLSYVTGRSVGIGAYLNRLGQRNIQMENGPMILTGYSALNKLLGREVYTSQDQLGGPQVMHPNGVSHSVVKNDRDGVDSILNWLSYVPKTANDVVSFAPSEDPVARPVEFKPSKTPYDPRNMLAGVQSESGWTSGFFDEGTFQETLSGWGKSVVVGRGKLGGIPVGCIAVETRLVDRRIPADPANPESRETLEPQAGQVWFPDSAFKTAQAIEDFNRGENLPLIIFANWRGFSGGTRDMYGEILKFGAKIVDALRKYEQPVFIYIPPGGELRGGAWVVVDPTINPEYMEMYADKESRGGILEPPGICEVKYRAGDQLKDMRRLDPELQQLCSALDQDPENADLKAKIKQREDKLKPVYLNIAHEFADLHDRAGRMKAKGVIRDALEWESSREYFHWRIRRRVNELKWAKKFMAADSSLSMSDAVANVQKVVCAGAGASADDDKAMAHALEVSESELTEAVTLTKKSAIERQIQELQAELGADAPAMV